MKKEKPVIVYILPRFPWPPYAGQSRLSFYRAKQLRKKGYMVILICFSFKKKSLNNDLLKLKKVFNEIHLIPILKIDFIFIILKSVLNRFFNNIPLQASWLNSTNIKNKFKEKISSIEKQYKETFFHLYSIRSYYLWQIIEESRKPFAIDLVDSVTLNLERKCKILKNVKKYFWECEYNSSKNLEQNLPNFYYCKKYLVVSKLDKKYLKLNSPMSKQSIFVSSVGYNFPKYLNKFVISEKKDIIFFGSLSYEPNLSAINWLLEKVMPYVWEKDQNIFLKIAGRNPTRDLVNKCNRNEKIILIPNPISMSTCIKESIISVAPLISGSGQQFKIIESMANGIPVLSTKIGALPFGFINNRDLIIEDHPKKFANALVNLCHDSDKRETLRKNAFLKIKTEFGWENIVDNLERNLYI